MSGGGYYARSILLPVGLTVVGLIGWHLACVANSNILIGESGIGLNNVMFYTSQETSGTHFNVNNAIINGIALWSLAEDNGTINVNNSQGCVQLVADIVDLDDVRYNRCQFMIPEPSSLSLILLGGLMLNRRRNR